MNDSFSTLRASVNGAPAARAIRMTAGELVRLAQSPTAPPALKTAADNLVDPGYSEQIVFPCAGDVQTALAGMSLESAPSHSE